MVTAKMILLYLLNNNQYEIDTTSLDKEQLYCLALNVYHESRGEVLSGQFAVAHVTLNRTKDARYPGSVCGVVKQSALMQEDKPYLPVINKCQFSWYCDGRPDKIYVKIAGKIDHGNYVAFRQASEVAIMAMAGMSADNTNGSTHYYNYKRVNPYWARFYTQTTKHGDHAFMKREKDSLR